MGFTKCPKCQKYSINAMPPFGFPEGRIIDWECPYCFLILEGENWKKNIVQELKDEIGNGQNKPLFGKTLSHSGEEISPQKAKDLATDYLKKSNVSDFPPSFDNAKISDYVEEWQIDFKKIVPKGAIVIPDSYCVIVNKKTGETNEISLK